MKPILVAYATTEGYTRKIAEFIAERVRKLDKVVDFVDCATPSAEQVLPIYAGAFLCGSVHYQRHQSALAHFVRENLAWLNEIPIAFVSVNLAMLHKDADARAEAKQCADAFVDETGLRPSMVRLVAGALRYTHYDFFKRALLRYLVKPGGIDAGASGDAEYTDWEELGRLIDEFVATTQSEGR
jgi:menaquinone-dependent protoporphyrinogen oxidase